jgi:hypothetical protein
MQIDKSDGIVISHGTPDIDEIPDAAGRFIGAEINSVQEFEYPIHIASLIDDWNGLGEGDYYISFSGEIRYKDIFEKDHVAYFNWLLKSRNYERGFYINDPKANYTT